MVLKGNQKKLDVNKNNKIDKNDFKILQNKNKKNRASNNRARRIMSKAGLAKKGDGKDVAHRDNNSKNNTRSNLKMQKASKNRSFARTKTGKMK